MEELSILLDECKTAFIKTDDYRILKTYRTRADRFSFDERQSVINSINTCFQTVFERLKTEFPSLTKFDLQYCALYVVEAETVAIAECLCVSKDAVRMRKYRLRDKLSNAWYVTLFGEPQRNNLKSVTPDTDKPQTTKIPLSPKSTQKQKVMKTKMYFGEAIKQCYRKCFTYEGRASRAEFWYFYLFAFIVNLFYLSLHLLATTSIIPTVSESAINSIKGVDELLNWIVQIGIIVPMLSVTVRRLHDRDLPGWIILLIYVIPKLIGSLLICMHEKYWNDIQEVALEHIDFGIAFIIAYLIIFILIVSSVIVRLTMMAKAGDIGPNNYGADPIEVPNPKGTGLAVFKNKKVVVCLVLSLIGIGGIWAYVNSGQVLSYMERKNKSDKHAVEIVDKMEDFIKSHQADGITYSSKTIFPVMTDSAGNVNVVPFDEQVPDDFEKNLMYFEPYKSNDDNDYKPVFGNFCYITINYNVFIEEETEEYWIIKCTEKQYFDLKTNRKELKLKIKKDTFQPITMKANLIAAYYIVDDIVFGAGQN